MISRRHCIYKADHQQQEYTSKCLFRMEGLYTPGFPPIFPSTAERSSRWMALLSMQPYFSQKQCKPPTAASVRPSHPFHRQLQRCPSLMTDNSYHNGLEQAATIQVHAVSAKTQKGSQETNGCWPTCLQEPSSLHSEDFMVNFTAHWRLKNGKSRRGPAPVTVNTPIPSPSGD